MIWAFAEALARRLMAWSALSVGAGLAAWASGDAFWRGFGIQAVIWALVDAALAGFGYRAARRRARPPQAEARWLRRLLWVNAGLDVVYIAVGLALGGGRLGAAPELMGHGWGVVVQGSFLLIFDAYHAWSVPAEPSLPALPLYQGSEHQPFVLPAGRGAPAALLVHGFPGTPAEVRALGEALHGAGWTVQAPLLPGFGADLPTLIYRRWPEWVASLRASLEAAQRQHGAVLLVGYSFGGALAVEAAAGAPPAGLVLLAPFVWDESPAARLLVGLARPFLPHAFRPYQRADLRNPAFRHGLSKMAAGVNWDDPAAEAALRQLTVPVTLLAELRETRRALRLAPRVRAPALIVQGLQDTVSRPAVTRRLASRLAGPSRLAELAAGHDLIEPAAPAWPDVNRAVLEFASQLRGPAASDGRPAGFGTPPAG